MFFKTKSCIESKAGKKINLTLSRYAFLLSKFIVLRPFLPVNLFKLLIATYKKPPVIL